MEETAPWNIPVIRKIGPDRGRRIGISPRKLAVSKSVPRLLQEAPPQNRTASADVCYPGSVPKSDCFRRCSINAEFMPLPSLRFLRLCIALGLVAGGLLGAAEPSQILRVFLLAGQSNMEGADAHANRIDEYAIFKGTGAPQADVLFTSLALQDASGSALWRPLAPSDSFGPEITFARKLKKFGVGPIAIIKSAIGGTTVAFDWNPTAPPQGQKLYPRTLKLIRESLQELDRRGVHYQLEGVLWHQGENDMLDPKLNRQYAQGLSELITRLRHDLQAPRLQWFMGEVSEKGIWGMDNRRNLAILREQQDTVLQADPLLRWVPTSHLAFEVMGSGQPHYHFGTQGQLQLGEAFANAYLDAVGKPFAARKRSFDSGLPTLGKKGRVRVFVLAGQRTMEGEDAFVAQIPQNPRFEGLSRSQNDILFRYSLGGGVQSSRSWEPLGPVDELGNFGPELSLGALLRTTLPPQDTLAVVKFTHSGAQAPDWSPDGSPETRRNLYPKFSKFIREAMEDLGRQGHECTLEGVFWHTGENDTYFTPYQRNYAAGMRRLIAQVRQDLKVQNLPWFISEQHPSAIWKNVAEINATLRTLAQTEPGVFLVPTSHLPYERKYFGTQGTLLLGEEFAKAYWQQQQQYPTRRP